jgi:hypothetical protein
MHSTSQARLPRNLKKCGSCGQPGHMRTNKFCPNYNKQTNKNTFSFIVVPFFSFTLTKKHNEKKKSQRPFTPQRGFNLRITAVLCLGFWLVCSQVY